MNEGSAIPQQNNQEEVIEAVAVNIVDMLQIPDDSIEFTPERATIITRQQFDQ
ncbi:hypothetical protein H0Z09_22700 [Pseudomonas sp. SWRI18]|uniref:hypothetical protein n=1 Tax=Pseudomonas sp. SWRI18 TaxID=2753888 RepID=UPI0016472CEC|nr:hypothetical protein [Pseudomonas sp. SWRI18]MBC3303946.1 hypothetical protein [Pseudomonas sp. SWRI18]